MSEHSEQVRKRWWEPSITQSFAFLSGFVGCTFGWALGRIQSEILWLLPIVLGGGWGLFSHWFLLYRENFEYLDSYSVIGVFLVALFCGVATISYLSGVESLWKFALYWFGFAGLGTVVATVGFIYVDYRLGRRENPFGD